MGKSSLKKNSDFWDSKELEEFALKQGFKLKRKYLSENFFIISFYPMETPGFDENIYLSIYSNLILEKHKFLSNEEFKSYRGAKVSLNWVRRFLKFRSGMAKEDNEKQLIQIEINKKIEEENERNLPYDAEENLDKQRKKEGDRPLPKGSFSKSFSLDDYDDGPLSDDWDSANWEEYMGGPEDPIDN